MHKRFFGEETYKGEKNTKLGFRDEYWHSDQDVVSAIWCLVRMCNLDDTNNFATLVSDFVSRVLPSTYSGHFLLFSNPCEYSFINVVEVQVGIDDPHRVVFHLPGEISHTSGYGADKAYRGTNCNIDMDTAISDELLNSLMRLLKKYLMDDSVKIIDMASQALRVSL